jgi:Cft2 family RNA processing exonuclease
MNLRNFDIPIEIFEGDIYLPEINLWLDPQKKKDYAFVSHAHLDHAKSHKTILCSEQTKDFLQKRIKTHKFQTFSFFEEFKIGDYLLKFFPAGHILGSSMIFIKKNKFSLLFSGDFKIKNAFSAEKIEIPQANMLIMEASFGDKQFIFPEKEKLVEEYRKIIVETEKPIVFFTYPLGKSQEILMILKKIGIEKVFIDKSILKMNKIYEKYGFEFPEVSTLPQFIREKNIYLLPVGMRHHKLLKNKDYLAVYSTGWALDEKKNKEMKCDIAFPLSDHAGFDELEKLVEKVQPDFIITHHGRKIFSEYLEKKGKNVFHIEENIFNEG